MLLADREDLQLSFDQPGGGGAFRVGAWLLVVCGVSHVRSITLERRAGVNFTVSEHDKSNLSWALMITMSISNAPDKQSH